MLAKVHTIQSIREDMADVRTCNVLKFYIDQHRQTITELFDDCRNIKNTTAIYIDPVGRISPIRLSQLSNFLSLSIF
jgi:hypothetical protein